MTRFRCRGPIARAAVAVALLWTGTADAQVDVGDPQPSDAALYNLSNATQYDLLNRAKAERGLERARANLGRDVGRGDADAADRDARRIANLKFRIEVDGWLIRKNLLCDPGYYPYPVRQHPISCEAIAQYHRPPLAFDASSSFPTQGSLAPARPTVAITIVNAAPTGPGVAFAINGVAHQAAGGSRQDLVVVPDSTITYDAGGSLGQRRYQATPGVYEFRSTAEGWALYKLPGTP